MIFWCKNLPFTVLKTVTSSLQNASVRCTCKLSISIALSVRQLVLNSRTTVSELSVGRFRLRECSAERMFSSKRWEIVGYSVACKNKRNFKGSNEESVGEEDCEGVAKEPPLRASFQEGKMLRWLLTAVPMCWNSRLGKFPSPTYFGNLYYGIQLNPS